MQGDFRKSATLTEGVSRRAELGLGVGEDSRNTREITADEATNGKTGGEAADGTNGGVDNTTGDGDVGNVANDGDVNGERGGERGERDGREDGDGGEGEHFCR